MSRLRPRHGRACGVAGHPQAKRVVCRRQESKKAQEGRKKKARKRKRVVCRRQAQACVLLRGRPEVAEERRAIGLLGTGLDLVASASNVQAPPCVSNATRTHVFLHRAPQHERSWPPSCRRVSPNACIFAQAPNSYPLSPTGRSRPRITDPPKRVPQVRRPKCSATRAPARPSPAQSAFLVNTARPALRRRCARAATPRTRSRSAPRRAAYATDSTDSPASLAGATRPLAARLQAAQQRPAQ